MDKLSLEHLAHDAVNIHVKYVTYGQHLALLWSPKFTIAKKVWTYEHGKEGQQRCREIKQK